MTRLLPLLAVLALLPGCARIMHEFKSPEMRAAVEAANKTRINGPIDVRLTDGTILALVEGLSYLPAQEGERILRALGERPGPGLLGVVITDSAEPMLIAVLYSKGKSPRGVPQVEVVGWDPAELPPLRPR